jgi:hypothetical protein
MADPRLNSLHLATDRRQAYRRARESLLRAAGAQTLYVSRGSDSQDLDHTAIRKRDGMVESKLICWLSNGEFLYPLQIGVNTVGRSSDNDVVLEDVYASRRHCAILVHSDETCELHDTASKNGTCVNGTRIAGPTPLKPGDEIRISTQQFIFLTRGADLNAPSSGTLNG